MSASASWLEDAWERLSASLKDFGNSVRGVVPGLQLSIHRSENNAFPLRASLAMTIENCGEELAVVVDMQGAIDLFGISSDLVWDNGQVVTEGPTVDNLTGREGFDAWLMKFQGFLRDVRPRAAAEIVRRAGRPD